MDGISFKNLNILEKNPPPYVYYLIYTMGHWWCLFRNDARKQGVNQVSLKDHIKASTNFS